MGTISTTDTWMAGSIGAQQINSSEARPGQKETDNVSNIQPQGTNPYEQAPLQQPRKKHTLRNVLLISGACLVGMVGCSVAVAAGSSGGNTAAPAAGTTAPASKTEAPKTTAPKPKSAPAPATKQSDEDKFVAIVQKASAEGQSADNDLKAGLIMKKRDKAICGLGGTKITNWTGTVKLLDSNGDGDGVLAVELADGVVVTTWNNAFSDIGSDTLIKNEKLMDRLAGMSEGDKVTFSGQFIRGSDAGVCRDVQGLTKIGKLQEPEFTFRFSDVKAA